MKRGPEKGDLGHRKGEMKSKAREGEGVRVIAGL